MASFNTNCIIFQNVEISKKGTKDLLRKIKNSSVWHGIFKFYQKKKEIQHWNVELACHGVSSTSNLVVIVVVDQVKDVFPELFFTASVQREETWHGI
jgi:hypothetical protein